MASDNGQLGKILQNRITANSSNGNWRERLSIEAVDQLADELCGEYRNSAFRSWYCKVIYEFGPSQVQEWQARAKEANHPGLCFSKLAAQGLKAKAARERIYG